MSKKIDKSALGYNSFHDVLTEVRDTLCLDLTRFASVLPSAYANCLKPPPSGVYVSGRLEPILNFEDGHYYRHSTLKKALDQLRASSRVIPIANLATILPADVTDFTSFMQSSEPIVNHEGKAVAPPPAKMKKLFREEGPRNYSAIYLLVIAAYEHLDRLHDQTSPVSYLPQLKMKKSAFVRPECISTNREFLENGDGNVFDEAENPGIGKMLDEIENFIGRDREMQYSIRMLNTTLILEKGNDYRVIEYYRPIFDQLDEWDHALGC